jgi:hypothetical protein
MFKDYANWRGGSGAGREKGGEGKFLFPFFTFTGKKFIGDFWKQPKKTIFFIAVKGGPELPRLQGWTVLPTEEQMHFKKII